MEPLLAVYAGYSLGGVREMNNSQMPGVLKEALDMLEYCMGSPSTKNGALRAKHGHPKPFNIKFVEIGNEDWFSKNYAYRWKFMYKGLKAKYPKITYISTAYNEKGYKLDLPPGVMYDAHHYEEPQFFLKNFNFWDNWRIREKKPGVGVLLGEYSVFQSDTPSKQIVWDKAKNQNIHYKYPRLMSAIAEGVYAMGGERNPNTVWMSSYAPSLQRKESSDWDPNMIYFSTNTKETVLTPSYWQQWMFSRYQGTHTLPVRQRSGKFNPLFWHASFNEPSGDVYLKVINAGSQTAPLTVRLDSLFSSVAGTILTSNHFNDQNDFSKLNAVRPKPITGLQLVNGTMRWNVPRWSVNAIYFRQR